MPEAPPPRAVRAPEPKPERRSSELPGVRKRSARPRFRLVTERGLNPVVYPLAVAVAVLLGLGAARGQRAEEVALEPMEASGPPLSVLDDARPAPSGSATPAAPAAPPSLPVKADGELQLSGASPSPTPTAGAAASSGPGTLRVDGPRGARLFVDRKAQGAAPQSLTLAAGVHQLRAMLPGGAVREELVRIEPGKTLHRTLGAGSGKVVPPQPHVNTWP
jgi:hypothetical protein